MVFAIKVIKIKQEKQIAEVENEVCIVNKLDSPLVMKVIEHFRYKEK